MVDAFVHQVRLRLPRQVATLIQHAASRDGLRTSALGRMIVREWLRRQAEQSTEQSFALSPRRRGAGNDVAVRVWLSEDSWEALRLLSEAHDDTIGGLVARILTAAATSGLSGPTLNDGPMRN
jgi:hypothetical protein